MVFTFARVQGLVRACYPAMSYPNFRTKVLKSIIARVGDLLSYSTPFQLFWGGGGGAQHLAKDVRKMSQHCPRS